MCDSGSRIFHTGASKQAASPVDVFLIGNNRLSSGPALRIARRATTIPDWRIAGSFFSAAMALPTDFPGFDVLHCHDHQTDLFRVTCGGLSKSEAFGGVDRLYDSQPGYQGFSARQPGAAALATRIFIQPAISSSTEWLRLMKAGITNADLITTVSPRPMRLEIQQSSEFGYSCPGVRRQRREALIGVLNGIDDQPESSPDPRFRRKYTKSNLAGSRKTRPLITEIQPESIPHGLAVLAMISLD
jgi:glycogen synthase